MKTVTSLFQSEQHASIAASHLEHADIPSAEIDIWSTPHNLAPLLEDEGVSRSDAYAYVEGVRRGGSLVLVRCPDDKVDKAVEILDREGVLDLDEQQTSWRSEGWPDGVVAEIDGSLYEASGPTPASSDMAAGNRPDRMSHGRVRIQSSHAKHPARK